MGRRLHIETSPVATSDVELTPSHVELLDQVLKSNYSDLARRSGLRSRGFVARVIKGEANFSIETAVRIATAAGVSLDELVAYVKIQREKRKVGHENR